MATLNRVILIGNLTRDPELRVTPRGTSIVQFGLAINNSFKGQDGQQRDETTFVDCEAWAKTADLIAKYLSKGAPAMIEGRLKLDTWEDKQSGAKRSKLKVVVENVQFLSSKGEQQGDERTDKTTVMNEPPTSTPTGGSLRNPPPKPAQQENIDEDVPF
jgi:single-strand DNA-binding protein